MDEVISRSSQFKKEDDQHLPKTSCQRQQICDNVVKVKFSPQSRISVLYIGTTQYLEVPNCSEGLPARFVSQEGHNSSSQQQVGSKTHDRYVFD